MVDGDASSVVPTAMHRHISHQKDKKPPVDVRVIKIVWMRVRFLVVSLLEVILFRLFSFNYFEWLTFKVFA